MIISEEKLREMVSWLGDIGGSPNGLTRLLYDENWAKAQYQLKEKMKSIGMSTTIDSVGNLSGILMGTEKGQEIIATGSHVDSVIHGGKLDGAFGIIGGFLAIESLLTRFGMPKRTIELLSFAEEEGSRFPYVFWGSKNYLNLINKETYNKDIKNLRDINGVSFQEAMETADFAFEDNQENHLHRSQVKAFVELHIEQGNVLEIKNKKIGVVNAIAGQRRYEVILTGEANHAGTTPMAYRKDAVVAFSEICAQSTKLAVVTDDLLVLTFGHLVPEPNVVNVVAGKVTFTIDCRHPNNEVLHHFTQEMEQLMGEIASDLHVEIDIDRWMDSPPVLMDTALSASLEKVVIDRGYPYMTMHSGAGHDAQNFAPIIPTTMIFVPSIAGVSHNKDEWTSPRDLVAGVEVLTDLLYELAYK